MKEKLSANKGILAVIIIFILVMVLYKILFRPDDTLIPDESVAANIGTDIINLKNDLEKVNFDQSLFASPGYLGLIDFSIAIPDLPVGRVNPFANIGRD
ncbi:MAG: hypothetical protein WBL19_02720 [Minisyncoccia bacterium]